MSVRQRDGLKAVAEHFGGTFHGRQPTVALPLCDRDTGDRPLYAGEGLRVHVLGFSPSGTIAWLEERATPSGGAKWILNVHDLMNDSELAAKAYDVSKPGAEAFCARSARDAGKFLIERGVTADVLPTFDKPAPGADSIGVLVRPRTASSSEVVMQGRQGSKVIGNLPAAAGAAQALGFLRSPFEARVAVMTLMKAADGRSVVRVFGGRLDKGWTHEPAPTSR